MLYCFLVVLITFSLLAIAHVSRLDNVNKTK